MSTQRHKTSNPYEDKFGYSRAVRKGPFIFVSGTTSIDTSTGTVLYPKSAYDQTLKIFAEIVLAIEALGGTKNDVVRLRMFVAEEKDSEGEQGFEESLWGCCSCGDDGVWVEFRKLRDEGGDRSRRCCVISRKRSPGGDRHG